MKIILQNVQETFSFAKDFAKKLKGGEIIGLVGELGSGKTVFVKGLAKGLGIKEYVTSPTFIKMRTLLLPPGRKIKKLVHIDAYRIENVDEVIDLGLENYLDKRDTIIVIEWADKLKKILPQDTIWIYFKYGKTENERTVVIEIGYGK